MYNRDGADELRVLADYEGFKRFFDGATTRYAFKNKLAPIFLREFDYLCLSSSGRSQIQRWGSAKQKYLTDTIVEYYDQPLEGALFFIGNEEAYVKIVKVKR